MPINVMVTLRRAMHSLLNERKRIDGQLRAIETALGVSTHSRGSNSARPGPRPRRMSPAARRALSQRMKAYWAAKRKEGKAKKS
jgi:hypothetical protein